MASPPARGSTPRAQRSWSTTTRLPRLRGDRPRSRPRYVRGDRPFARSIGSTGFPACAGIDPSLARDRALAASPPARGSTRPPRAMRLPRLRGDRPENRDDDPASWRLPRLRGDRPHPGIKKPRAVRLPRLRGDRPGTEWARCLWGGFPACAGIDPRVRGRSTSLWQASPPARGSTRVRAFTGAAVCGFPACAGIDPSLTRRRSASKSASPPARGSTLRWRLRAAAPRLPRLRGDRPTVVERSP